MFTKTGINKQIQKMKFSVKSLLFFGLPLFSSLLIINNDTALAGYSKCKLMAQIYAQSGSQEKLPKILRTVLPKIKKTTRVPIFLPSQLPSKLANGQPIYVTSRSNATGYKISLGTHPNCNAQACYVGSIIAERGITEDLDAEKTQLARNIIGYYMPRSYKVPPSISWRYQGINYSISLQEYLYTNAENPNPNNIKEWLIQVANSAIVPGLR